MAETEKECPFSVGDFVRFEPDTHAAGWSWPSFERVGLKPGDVGVITRIERGQYLYIDKDRGGFHWECFRKAEP